MLTNTISADLKNNLRKIEKYARLEHNWDGYGAAPINKGLIEKIKYLLEHLENQPSIFPDPDGLIQFEYEKQTGEFLSVEFLENNKVKIYKINQKTYDDESSEIIEFDVDTIVEEVEMFYAI